MKRIIAVLCGFSILILVGTSRLVWAQGSCTGDCTDPNAPDDPIVVNLAFSVGTQCSNMNHQGQCIVCCGTEVTVTLTAGDCDCDWECATPPQKCMDELVNWQGWSGSDPVRQPDGTYLAEDKVTRSTPGVKEYNVTADDTAEVCGHNDLSQGNATGQIVWVGVDKIKGPTTVCEDQWIDFEVEETDPQGYVDEISGCLEWAAPGGEIVTVPPPGRTCTIRWADPGVYPVTVGCGLCAKTIYVKVVKYPP